MTSKKKKKKKGRLKILVGSKDYQSQSEPERQECDGWRMAHSIPPPYAWRPVHRPPVEASNYRVPNPVYIVFT